MQRKQHPNRPHKRRPVQQLVRLALRERDSHRRWRAINELRSRGSPALLELTRSLSVHQSWRRRCLGLFIAAQLQNARRSGESDRADYAVEETQALLLAGLRDQHDEVIRAAVSGLGHRPHPDAQTDLVRLSTHHDAWIRWDVAVTLSRYAEPLATETLLKLARDPDSLVRDWATFGLGSMRDTDTPEIRELLWCNLHDEDEDVRGEALSGLAARADPRAIAYLLDHLDENCRVYELDAAKSLACPEFLEPLRAIAAGLPRDQDIDGYWRHRLEEAIAACSQTTLLPSAAPPDDNPQAIADPLMLNASPAAAAPSRGG